MPTPLPDGQSGSVPAGVDAERLRRFAFLMLAPSLGRRRRATLAQHAVEAAVAGTSDPTAVRTAVIVEVLRASGGRTGIPTLIRVPRPSRQVGHPVGETEHHLGALIPAARAAYLLTQLEGLTVDQARDVLRTAGIADPETALALGCKCPLEPSVLAAVDPPGPRRVAPRLVAAGVGIVVLGIAAPVIAVTTGGGNDSPAQPTSVTTPANSAKPDGPAPAADPAAESAAVSAETTQKLAVLLGRLEQRLADHRGTKADKKRLRQLRNAMAAQLEQLNKAAKASAGGETAQ